MNNLFFSSKSQEWGTPRDLFDKLNKVYKFNLDVCASELNHKLDNYITKSENCLSRRWNGRCYMNPPYGKVISDFVKKAVSEVLSFNCSLVVCLLPARTDTKWFHYLLDNEFYYKFIKGRLKFEGAKSNSAPFPSCLFQISHNIDNYLEKVDYTKLNFKSNTKPFNIK